MDIEKSVPGSHGIEQGNDLPECVITRRDCHSLIIAVSNHIRRIHVVKHSLGLLGSKQDSHGSDGWIPILVGLIHSIVPLVGEPCMSMEQYIAYSLYHYC